jgi:hypothetical protein
MTGTGFRLHSSSKARLGDARTNYENLADRVGNADALRMLCVVALNRSQFEEKLAEALSFYEDFIDRLSKA